jgi:two-component system OmpR family sensor kinase
MHEKLVERWNAISLRTKMTTVSVLLLTLGLLVAGLGSMSVLRGYLMQDVDKRVSNALEGLRTDGAFQFPTDDTCYYVSDIPSDYAISFYAADGSFMCSNKPADERPSISAISTSYASHHDLPFTLPSTTGLDQWRIATHVFEVTPAALTSGLAPFQVSAVVGLNLNDTTTTIAKFAAIFLFFGLTVVIVGAALTRLLVTSTFAPLRDVEATAARFAAGDFTQRLGGATPNTEVGRLNRSLNSMLNRIDRAFADRAKTIDQMRRFVGDASHELRTPLVSVRGYAELYRMGALPNDEAVAQAMERIEKEAIRMSGLVADLLELARIDETKPLQLADVDLVALARDAALDAMASSPGRTVSVVVSEPEASTATDEAELPVEDPQQPDSALVTGRIVLGAALARLRTRRQGRSGALEPARTEPVAVDAPTPRSKVIIMAEENKIRQVVTNLMGNALRFTPDDSPIEIGVDEDAAAGAAVLSIIDHGEGIPPQIREKIFQRFWRADSSRNRDTGGSGLGLAIVASIVSAHRGRIDVLDTPGGGATFRVVLPLLQPVVEPAASTAPTPTA